MRFCNTEILARILKITFLNIMELKITSPYKLCMFYEIALKIVHVLKIKYFCFHVLTKGIDCENYQFWKFEMKIRHMVWDGLGGGGGD